MKQAELFHAVVDICILIILAELASTLNDRLKRALPERPELHTT